MNYTIDANVFVSAFRPMEKYHADSRMFLQLVQRSGIKVSCPTLVIPESVAAIARITDDTMLIQDVLAMIEDFENLNLIPLDTSLAYRTADIAKMYRLRGPDSVYVAVAQFTKAMLITWDAEILVRGAVVVPTLTPKQWLEQFAI